MSWYDNLTESVSSVYDNTVKTATDYFNTKINDFTKDPEPSLVNKDTQATQAQATKSGILGYSWVTLGAIATVLTSFMFFFSRVK